MCDLITLIHGAMPFDFILPHSERIVPGGTLFWYQQPPDGDLVGDVMTHFNELGVSGWVPLEVLRGVGYQAWVTDGEAFYLNSEGSHIPALSNPGLGINGGEVTHDTLDDPDESEGVLDAWETWGKDVDHFSIWSWPCSNSVGVVCVKGYSFWAATTVSEGSLSEVSRNFLKSIQTSGQPPMGFEPLDETL